MEKYCSATCACETSFLAKHNGSQAAPLERRPASAAPSHCGTTSACRERRCERAPCDPGDGCSHRDAKGPGWGVAGKARRTYAKHPQRTPLRYKECSSFATRTCTRSYPQALHGPAAGPECTPRAGLVPCSKPTLRGESGLCFFSPEGARSCLRARPVAPSERPKKKFPQHWNTKNWLITSEV